MIFCLDLPQNGAENLVNRLEKALEQGPLSMSFGIATYPEDGGNIEALIDVADTRLYQVKKRCHIPVQQPHQKPNCQCIECKCALADETS